MTSGAERPVPAPVRWSRRVPLDEQVRAKDPRPIGNGSSYVREGLVVEPGELKESRHRRRRRDQNLAPRPGSLVQETGPSITTPKPARCS
jgi:hypothetical protein